ncbi:DUF4347 domain-containing protein [Leptothermofonsia sp. ETS-13]|uniref:DUF4347 domain-containing protein n=1 Tax=Leptothermofonsia sp. ETS-13 TaxID=3035696 RepID=UPI003B9F39A7
MSFTDSLFADSLAVSQLSSSGSPFSPSRSFIEGNSLIDRPIPRPLSSSLVFIDSTVEDYQSLVSGASAGTEVHVLNSAQDAIAQITQVLAGRTGISSLHIVSHGEAGVLNFGSTQLGLGTLATYSTALQSWATALTPTADILLYGCYVAAGTQGQTFVQQLEKLTGADIAASIDLTGSAVLGGNWNLEYATGSIESSLAFRSATLATYASTLDIIVEETFRGADVNQFNWIYGVSRTGAADPFLTARSTVAPSQPGGLPGGGTDTPSNGALRFTNNVSNQGSFVIYDRPINRASGLTITFDLYAYGGTGADGISFFLIDGSANPTTAGGTGGSLGYSSNTRPGEAGPGIVGGYLGIGFDEFGNFSTTFHGSNGNGSPTPDSVAIRGNEASDYRLLRVVAAAPSSIDNPGGTATRANSRRRVQIDITPAGLVSVQLDLNDNNIFETSELLVSSFDVTSQTGYSAPLPQTFKFGWSASTGGSTNFHEINNFRTETFGGAPYIPLVRFAPTSGTVNEGGTLDLTVSLDLPTSNTVTVPLTLSGTATNGADYTIPTSITIAPGQTTGTITLTAINDLIPEGNETVIVTLGTPTNADLNPEDTVFTATIVDGSGSITPSFSIVNNASRSEGTRGNKVYPFTVMLSQALSETVSVSYTTVDGTATVADNDYIPVSGTLTFTPGVTSQTINVTVVGDQILEGTERFTVTLSNPIGGGTTITNGVGTGIIGDDDGNGPDFNLDGNVDIFWRREATNENQIWLMNGATFADFTVLPLAAAEWSLEGYGDFNDDGVDDILWHNKNTLETVIWVINGPAFGTFTNLLPISADYEVADIGDFDGDNRIDILWRSTITGENAIWLMDGTSISAISVLTPALPTYTIADVGDFDGDGDLDLLWRNYTTGETSFWLLNNASFGTFNISAIAQPTFQVIDTADLDGDGDLDILWNDTSTGETVVWVMQGTTIASTVTLAPALTWTGISILDLERDGALEFFWRNYNTGQNVIWRMNDTNIAGAEELLAAVPGWQPLLDD